MFMGTLFHKKKLFSTEWVCFKNDKVCLFGDLKKVKRLVKLTFHLDEVTTIA